MMPSRWHLMGEGTHPHSESRTIFRVPGMAAHSRKAALWESWAWFPA